MIYLWQWIKINVAGWLVVCLNVGIGPVSGNNQINTVWLVGLSYK